MKRSIQEKITGFQTTDGAGVNLVRVLGPSTVESFDPILMLDSFDSENPDDYIRGFPLHPHRGLETISLISKGHMLHRDSLGHEEAISDGEVQWMTAGSGIMHEEMLPASARMLGVQLWLNLPKSHKMAPPEYHSIKKQDIKEIPLEKATLRLISGRYKDHVGFLGKYLPLDYYHILLKPRGSLTLEMSADQSVMVFLLLGNARVAGEEVEEKTAVKLGPGTQLELEALEEDVEILYISSFRLDEPVAWGGPIVMNTSAELRQAFTDLKNGTFLKDGIKY